MCGALQGMTHKKIADGEVVEIALQKSPDGVAWRVDDGLFMHVETGVNDGWNTAQSIVFLDDTVEAGVGVCPHQLRARRAIDMHCGRTGTLHKIGAVKRDRHKLRRMFCAINVVVAAMAFLKERRRRKGHELCAAQALIQPLVDLRLARMIEDGAVAQRPRAIFHPPVETRDDIAVVHEPGDHRFDGGDVLKSESGGLQLTGNEVVRVIWAEIDSLIRLAFLQMLLADEKRCAQCHSPRRPCSDR